MKKFLLIFILILAFVLRFYKLNEVPPSLNWDEASLGYNAYSISQTLHDEHNEFLPLARFIAFGDYKPPGYIYTDAFFVKLLGLNDISVRLPSVLAGTLLVLVTYFLVKELFDKDGVALVAALFVSVSPWALQFSRGAFEANLAAFLNALAVLFFILFVNKKKGLMLVLSTIFFVLSFYTFNANRIIAPLLLVGLSIIFWRKVLAEKKWLIISIVTGLIMISPSLPYLQSRESKLRFQEVSIFNQLSTVETANNRIKIDNSSWWSKIVHNRRFLFAQDFLVHYFDNFKGRFLFISGDANPRLSIQELGELYLFDLPFLIIGFYLLIKRRNKYSLVLFYWLLVAPIPAATAKETPHALRILSILPVPQIIVALGFWEVYTWFEQKKREKLFIIVSSLALFINFSYYLHMYYVHYPIDWSQEWQYGYKQVVDFASKNENKYDQVIMTNELGRPYIYFLFYEQTDPKFYWQTRIASRDWYGFWNVQGFGKYKFGSDSLKNAKGKILFIGDPGEIPKEAKPLETVNDLNGKETLKIVEIDR